jgi:DNA-3-methyladenine glycosylase II
VPPPRGVAGARAGTARAGAAPDEHCVEVREVVRPPWPFALRGGTPDGLLRRRGPALQRLLHHGATPVLVGVVAPVPGRVVFAARSDEEVAARWGLARMRFATGVDDDLRPFHDRFRDDPIIGRAVRSVPHMRVWRRPEPWEALAWAITEQLIDFERAKGIQRRLIARLGRRCIRTGLRDMPTAAAVAAEAPAALAAAGLTQARAITLRRVAHEVAAGRVRFAGEGAPTAEPLHAGDLASLRRLRAIPGVGRWTMEMLSLYGLGRYDRAPAGDLGFLEIVGRLQSGNPRAHADEAEVRGLLARYGEWQGLAGEYLRLAAARGLLPLTVRPRAPRPAGTRSYRGAPDPVVP